MQSLKEQAEVIKLLFGSEAGNIWGNVIIIAKQGTKNYEQYNFQVTSHVRRKCLVDNLLTLQGALAAISDLEKGNQDYVSRVQCLQYDLDFKNTQSLDSARSLLNRAFAKITNPVEVQT